MHRNGLLAMLCVVSVFSGCGKHEAAQGAGGAVAGALVGGLVTDDEHRGEGVLLGSAIGNIIGRITGGALDEHEAEIEREAELASAVEEGRRQERIDTSRRENRIYKSNGYCQRCAHYIKIAGARSCPSCGDGLIREKFCGQCSSCFAVDCSYRYCPYCSQRARLTVC